MNVLRQARVLMAGVLAFALAATAVLAVSAAAPASAAQACSAVQVAASSWLGGGGVGVHSNGPDQGSGNSCAGWSTAAPSSQDGYGWQCVELATRLYYVKGWGSVRADGGAAAGAYRYGAKYIPEGSPSLAFHPNGSGYVPVPGDLIVEWSATWGHVSVVDNVVGSSVYAVEQNASLSGRHTYGLTGSTLTGQYGSSVRGVMHAPGNTNTSGAGGIAEGSFIQVAGQPAIYRVAGGAPTYVSTWNAFGGSQPTTVVSQSTFNAMRPVPADGTFVTGAQRGEVYRISGGAPLYVSNWALFGGPQPTTTIDQAAIDSAGAGDVWNHLNYRPADGTFIAGAQRGEVYRIVGGAPTYVSTWSIYGGPQPLTTVDDADIDNAGAGGIWNHLSYRPADGTFVAGAQRGEVYRFAGGAPIYVNTWDAFGGPQPVTTIDQFALDSAGGATGALSHVLQQPGNGTFVTGIPSGRVFRINGGIAAYVPSWAPYGGPQPTVAVVDAALDYAGSGSPWQHLVSATPISQMTLLPSATTASQVLLTWTKPILSSAISGFDLRWQSASATSAFGAWQYGVTGWSGVGIASPVLSPGGTYCFSVRAHNLTGMTGPWSASRCVSRYLDDRSLAASAGWLRPSADPRYYLGTHSGIRKLGATLTLTNAQVSRITVLATRCLACGYVSVYVGSTLVGTINLKWSTTQRQVAFALKPFSFRSGKVTLKSLNGAAVEIDGLAVSRI